MAETNIMLYRQFCLLFLPSIKARSHRALRLITAKSRQKVVSREADNVVCIDVEFKTSYSRFIDAAGHGEKSGRCRTL